MNLTKTNLFVSRPILQLNSLFFSLEVVLSLRVNVNEKYLQRHSECEFESYDGFSFKKLFCFCFYLVQCQTRTNDTEYDALEFG